MLKPTGSLYLHCDPTASHYLKVVLDTVFGARELPQRDHLEAHNAHSDMPSKRFGVDVRTCILFYTKVRS